jgi:hypothetical protein
MIASILIATIVVLRILFLMTEIGNLSLIEEIVEFGNKIENDDAFLPMTKQLLRGMPTAVVAYERFEKIYGAVMFTAATGGHIHKYNLCYKNNEVITIIDAMVREAFPDSKIEHAHVQNLKNNCTAYKISW